MKKKIKEIYMCSACISLFNSLSAFAFGQGGPEKKKLRTFYFTNKHIGNINNKISV